MTPEAAADRKAAYRDVRLALSAGTLVRPEACAHCGAPKPQAHHHWGYQGKNRLRVLWLCGRCHLWLHKAGHCPAEPPLIVRLALLILMEWQARPDDATWLEATV